VNCLALLVPALERTRHRDYNLLSLFRQAALNADIETLAEFRGPLLRIARSAAPIGEAVKAIVDIVEARKESAL
jgi:hypothetical protein